MLLVNLLPSVVAFQGQPTFQGPTQSGNCTFYHNQSAHCSTTGCGSCFNAGARTGVKCKGSGGSTGYYCPSETTATSGDITFACMDWTLGSSAMRAAETAFTKRTGEDVFFGVGTFGTSSDAQHGLAACYRLHVDGVTKDIIAQSINTGHDVAGNQFDLQIGAGGAGAFNTCAGDARSMFPGTVAAWGCQYGGIDSLAACSGLPEYPRNSAAMKAAYASRAQGSQPARASTTQRCSTWLASSAPRSSSP